MSYNARIKKFGNGTLQLTFYGRPILSKDDFPTDVSAIDRMSDDEICGLRNDCFIDINDDVFELIDLDPFTSSFSDLSPSSPAEDTADDTDRTRSVRSSMNRSKRMIYDYGRSNVWEWFFTLTFARVNGFTAENYDECRKKVSKWFQNIKYRYCPDMIYLIVPEQHESGAWHFHAMVSNIDGFSDSFVPAVNNQEFRKNGDVVLLNKKGQPVRNKYFGQILRTSYPDGNIIYNIPGYRFGFSTATRILDTRKTVSYVVKYITEDLSACTFGKRRYLPSRGLKLPERIFLNISPDELTDYLSNIEYVFGQKMSIEHTKIYKVDVENYCNYISIFEFVPRDEASGSDKEVP